MNTKLLILAGVTAFSFNCTNAMDVKLEPREISIEKDCSSAKEDSLYAKILTQLAWISIEDTQFYDPEWASADSGMQYLRKQLRKTVGVILDSVNHQDQYSALKQHEKDFFYGNTKTSQPEFLLDAYAKLTQDDIARFLSDAQIVLNGLKKIVAEAKTKPHKMNAWRAEIGIPRIEALIKIITSNDINDTAKTLTPALIVLGDKTLLAASNIFVRKLEKILGRELDS